MKNKLEKHDTSLLISIKSHLHINEESVHKEQHFGIRSSLVSLCTPNTIDQSTLSGLGCMQVNSSYGEQDAEHASRNENSDNYPSNAVIIIIVGF